MELRENRTPHYANGDAQSAESKVQHVRGLFREDFTRAGTGNNLFRVLQILDGLVDAAKRDLRVRILADKTR